MTQSGTLDTVTAHAQGVRAAPARLAGSLALRRAAVYALAACFVALAWLEQWRLLTRLLSRLMNADHALLWLAARDWSRLELREPTFYGQSYGVTLEAIPTALLHALGATYAMALPLALFALAWGAWLCLAVGAFRRGMPLAGLSALAAPSLLNVDHWIVVGVIATGVGRLLSAVCAQLALRDVHTRRRVFAMVSIGGLAVAFDTASAILVAPALVWAGWRWLRVRRLWLPAALGLIAPLAWVALNAWFTRVHPDHDFHKTWSFVPELRVLLKNYRAPNLLFQVQSLELWQNGALIPLSLAALLCLTAVLRAPREAAVVASVLLQLVYLASLYKSLDDQKTLWFPSARMTLGVPMAVWFASVLSLRAIWKRLGARRYLWPVVRPLAAALLVLLVSSSAAVRALHWDEHSAEVEQAGLKTRWLPLMRPWDVRVLCDPNEYSLGVRLYGAPNLPFIAELMALCAWGRSRVISATPSETSYLSVVNAMPYSRCRIQSAQPVG